MAMQSPRIPTIAVSAIRLAWIGLTMVLAGCYAPINGVRDPLPPPGPTPPWPYQDNAVPPGARSAPALDQTGQSNWIPQARGYPYGTVPAGAHQRATSEYDPPMPARQAQGPRAMVPPVEAVRPQYPAWAFDGPEGRGFAYYLAQGYRRLAKDEDNQHDFDDAARFLARAGAVDRGERVEPEPLLNRVLPAYAADDLLYARQRIMRAFNRGATGQMPKLAAYAQVMFDCWMEQQEENIQPHDVARCRGEFEITMARIEEMLGGKLVSTGQCPGGGSAPCPSPCGPCGPCGPCPAASLVYFEFDKSDLTAAAQATIQAVAQTVRSQSIGGLVVSGHTDRSGSDHYNEGLSKRRLETVVNALIAAGLSGDSIAKALYYGESQPRVPTPDGQRLAENRRVEIRFACQGSTMPPAAPARPAAACGAAGTFGAPPALESAVPHTGFSGNAGEMHRPGMPRPQEADSW
jgi:OOP family OmpA-OmpF porin